MKRTLSSISTHRSSVIDVLPEEMLELLHRKLTRGPWVYLPAGDYRKIISRIATWLILFLSIFITSFKLGLPDSGIEGQVYWVEGNQMPGIKRGNQENKRPVQRTIYFFEPIELGKAKGDGSIYKIITGKLIEKTKTNKEGYFKVKLEPGKYSVFTKEDQGWFASVTDGHHINPVIVKEGEYTKLEIEINYKAFY